MGVKKTMTLTDKINEDLVKIRYMRGIYAICALSISIGEVVCAGVAVALTATGSYESASIATLLSGFIVTVDASFRLRETAAELNTKMVQLINLKRVGNQPTKEWDTYLSISDSTRLSYVSAIYEMCMTS